MKHTNLFLGLFASALIFSSCGSDDDNNTVNNTSGSIEGKWAYSKTGFSVGSQESLESHTHTAGCNKDYIQFLSNGKYYDVEYQTGCVPDTLSAGTYVKSGNTLTIGEDRGDVEPATIITLTNSELKLAASYTQNGVTYNTVGVFTKE
jgi:hypothetical protein